MDVFHFKNTILYTTRGAHPPVVHLAASLRPPLISSPGLFLLDERRVSNLFVVFGCCCYVHKATRDLKGRTIRVCGGSICQRRTHRERQRSSNAGNRQVGVVANREMLSFCFRQWRRTLSYVLFCQRLKFHKQCVYWLIIEM